LCSDSFGLNGIAFFRHGND